MRSKDNYKKYLTLDLRMRTRPLKYETNWLRQNVWKPAYRKFFCKAGLFVKARFVADRNHERKRQRVSLLAAIHFAVLMFRTLCDEYCYHEVRSGQAHPVITDLLAVSHKICHHRQGGARIYSMRSWPSKS